MTDLRRGFWEDEPARAAFASLMRDVFGEEPVAAPDREPLAFFDASGQCLAGLELVALPLVLDGVPGLATGIGSVAVGPAFRGRGLFRALMEQALPLCQGPALLYTEDPALYRRFGFRDLPQHRVVGPPPPILPGRAATCRLSLETDRALITRLLPARSPVSNQVAVAGGATQLLRYLGNEGEIRLDYWAAREALILTEPADNDCLTIADIVAPSIPPLAGLLSAMGRRYREIRVLFPVDKLGWTGRPEPEETGLMIRGDVPAAFGSPFMLPPTMGF